MVQSKGIEWQNEFKKKKKHDPSIFGLQETHFRSKDTHTLKVKR